MLNQLSSFCCWQLRTDVHPLSQLIPRHPRRKVSLSPFSHIETVSEVKELTQGSTARDLSTFKAHRLPSTPHSSAWSFLPQCSFYSEAGGYWGGEREFPDQRGECCHPLYICLVCFPRTWTFIPLFILLLLNSDPNLRDFADHPI